MGCLPIGLWNAFGVQVVRGRAPACAARRWAMVLYAFGIAGMDRVQESWCVETHPTGFKEPCGARHLLFQRASGSPLKKGEFSW
jgi:hypothetical protein